MPTKLKRTVADIDEVEETFRPHYIERDGKFVLDIEVEGMVPASKLEEFRTTTKQEKERREALEAQYADVNLEEYQALKGRAELLDEHKLIKKGDVDTVVQGRVNEAKRQFDEKEQSYRQREGTLKDLVARTTIEAKVVQVAISQGLKKGAAGDLIRRAREVFRMDDNFDIVAYEPDGKSPKMKLGDPYTFEDFVKDTADAEDGKHLFEGNTGGGGDPGKGSGGVNGAGTIVDPFAPETFNRAKQTELFLKNRLLAQKLAAKHGIRLG